MRAVILGFDGISWTLIKPLINSGLMPNFKRITDEGAYGALRSVIPPVTAPAWISFATGNYPGKHSIFNFILPGNSFKDLQTVSSKNIKCDTFYEILERNGIKTILINLPGSFPPKINTPIITSLMTMGNNPVFPQSLLDEIPELQSYRIVPDMSLLLEGKLAALIDDIRNLERHRFVCAQKLFGKDWDVFFLMFSGTDWIQHILPELSQGEPEIKQEEISKAKLLFSEIDSYFGWFIDRITDDMILFALSDHGFKTFDDTFQVNKWLEQEGYLKIEESLETNEITPHKVLESIKHAEKIKIEKNLKEWRTKRQQELEELKRYEEQFIKRRIILPSKLVDILRKTGLPKIFVYQWAKRALGLKVQKSGETVEVDRLLEKETLRRKMKKKIYNSQTSAACLSYESSGIYINESERFKDGIVDKEKYKEFRENLVRELRSLKNPISGKPVFTAVLKKEEAYWGTYLNLAPDIVLLRGDFEIGADLSGKIFNGKKLPGHSNIGIVMAFGKSVKNVQIESANIVDVVPTLFHFLRVRLPQDMDGKVLTEIFSDKSDLRQRDIVYENSQESGRLRRKVKRIIEDGKI